MSGGSDQPRELLTSAAVARLDRQLDALLRALSLVTSLRVLAPREAHADRL